MDSDYVTFSFKVLPFCSFQRKRRPDPPPFCPFFFQKSHPNFPTFFTCKTETREQPGAAPQFQGKSLSLVNRVSLCPFISKATRVKTTPLFHNKRQAALDLISKETRVIRCNSTVLKQTHTITQEIRMPCHPSMKHLRLEPQLLSPVSSMKTTPTLCEAITLP